MTSNDLDGIDGLVGHLAQEWPTLVVLEASGGYERPAATALAARGLAVAVVNPRQARAFAEATGRLAKTDALDAESLLARFAEVVRPEPRVLPDEETLLLGEILDRRRQLIGMLVAENHHLSLCDRFRAGEEAHPVARSVAREGDLPHRR